MASYKTAFPSKYLKAEDVPSRRTVTIKAVAFQDVGTGQNTDRKLVATFHEVDKGLVLNLVNSDTIADVAGTDDFDRWPGTRLDLYPTKTEFQGKRVPCIRISEPTTPATNGTVDTELGI